MRSSTSTKARRWPPGKKSLALRLSFRAPDRTLSDAEVNELRDGMLRQVADTLGAELRA